jgi:hypothetical protein
MVGRVAELAAIYVQMAASFYLTSLRPYNIAVGTCLMLGLALLVVGRLLVLHDLLTLLLSTATFALVSTHFPPLSVYTAPFLALIFSYLASQNLFQLVEMTFWVLIFVLQEARVVNQHVFAILAILALALRLLFTLAFCYRKHRHSFLTNLKSTIRL